MKSRVQTPENYDDKLNKCTFSVILIKRIREGLLAKYTIIYSCVFDQ